MADRTQREREEGKGEVWVGGERMGKKLGEVKGGDTEGENDNNRDRTLQRKKCVYGRQKICFDKLKDKR